MISIYPTIYHAFQCKADQCENTCCQLWTIDIDEPTAKRYHAMTGSLGESLRQAITVDDEGSHFIFSKASAKYTPPSLACLEFICFGTTCNAIVS